MALRCLDTWEFNGQTVNLAKITDFSKITQTIKDYTTPRYTSSFSQSSLPDWIVPGDVLYTFQNDANTYDFLVNDSIAIKLGKYAYNSTYYGMITYYYNGSSNSVITNWGNTSGNASPRYYRLGIVVDDDNSRAYLFIYTDYPPNSSRYAGGFVSYLFNGVDLLYESLPEPIQTYTSNGGGATHIAKVTGQLKDLSSNLSDILIVSGGGGGGLLLGDSGWHGTEQNIAWSGNNNKLTVQLDDDDVLFKMYIGSSNIYSFTAPVSDISNIYLQFLIDSENEVAKPSFVYKNGSSYSFNQEEPTDSEMGDIYTWLSAGLPSE